AACESCRASPRPGDPDWIRFFRLKSDPRDSDTIGAAHQRRRGTAPHAAADTDGATMAKVLTVDDSKVVRTMVTKALKPFACEIVEAANGQEGVEAAARERFDLILLDVTMPVMDGLQALTAIRSNAATKPTPVIMLAAESAKDLAPDIIRLGVKGYIVKPFSAESFAREVAKVLGAPGTQPAPAASAGSAQLTVTTEGGCPVIVCPDPRSKGFGGF